MAQKREQLNKRPRPASSRNGRPSQKAQASRPPQNSGPSRPRGTTKPNGRPSQKQPVLQKRPDPQKRPAPRKRPAPKKRSSPTTQRKTGGILKRTGEEQGIQLCLGSGTGEDFNDVFVIRILTDGRTAANAVVIADGIAHLKTVQQRRNELVF